MVTSIFSISFSIFYGILTNYLHWWYYYLELVFIIFGYALYSVIAGYWVSKSKSFAIQLLVSEIIVLVFTFSYLWILMPIYSALPNDLYRGAVRLCMIRSIFILLCFLNFVIVLHPIVTEVTMVMPSRYLQRRYNIKGVIYW